MNLSEIRNLTTFRLANEADVSCPDSADSAGSEFLASVRDSLCENIAYELSENHVELSEIIDEPNDRIHEIADGAVPIYTHLLWRTFVDLAAYGEDISEYVDPKYNEMDDLARISLYVIAERLCNVLVVMLSEDETADA